MSDSSSGSSWLERLGKVFSDEPESREDLVESLREAHNEGIIDADALLMIQGVLQVSEARVRDIMVPRPQIELIDATEPLDEILEEMLESSHSRYPVIEDTKIVGILLAKDVFRAVVKGQLQSKEDLQAIYREPVFVPESKRLNVLLRDFKESRNHMALVVDEYGELAGLVTIEDVIEQIVGDIEDEHDEEENDNIQKRAGEIYSVNAITPLDEFNGFFNLDIDEDLSETLGGYMAVQFGHVPAVDEEFVVDKLVIRVTKASERRAELFEVRPLKEDEAEQAVEQAI
ncbi:HlyC/CorC family transporter [Thiomicrorhabdus xiamenensis]|uniref:Magnesium and cobalt efflux protein CorC n=1 Tax=Thiomicrorhabdus xiamenensis TaxID=2739063 RepID=A0A7D4P3F4_9GAMM|nr:CBS domain-containing protein [Thiomicrorhabdus xiamenensis]QKI88556.1 CBS domain-containing protein [Thiomicrorhabdus xiamenensis]